MRGQAMWTVSTVAAVRELRVKLMIGGKLSVAAELSEPWTATQRGVYGWSKSGKALILKQG